LREAAQHSRLIASKILWAQTKNVCQRPAVNLGLDLPKKCRNDFSEAAITEGASMISEKNTNRVIL
jgi:hypothetical protein